MNLKVSVAILGVETPKGQALLEQLADSDFPYEKVVVVAENADVGESALLGNKQLPIEDAAEFDWQQVQMAFFACDAQLAARHLGAASAAGCIVFDLSAAGPSDYDVPVVANGVNDYALAEFRNSYTVVNPCCAALQLATVLKPVYDTVGIDRINVTCLQPVSESGKPGIDELAGQTAALLNGRPVEPKTYAKQIAFNSLPLLGSLLDNGYAEQEMQIIKQTQQLLSDDAMLVTATVVQTPVFYGQALSVSVETRDPVSAEWLTELLKQSGQIKVFEGQEFPTQQEQGSDSDCISVGRIREDISHGSGIHLWMVADDIRFAAVGNSLKNARTLLAEYF